jgi:FAD/FMN-containing dehydrogenase
VAACWAGRPADGEAVVAPLRSLAVPIADLLGPMPYVQLQSLLDAGWGAGAANYFTGAFVDDLSGSAIETLVQFQASAGELPVQAELHVHQLGGAMARVPSGDTAYAQRGHAYLVNCIARTPEAEQLPPHREWARSARDALARFGDGAVYVNFAAEAGQDRVQAAYPPETYRRLQQVKQRYDPANLFRFNHNITPST